MKQYQDSAMFVFWAMVGAFIMMVWLAILDGDHKLEAPDPTWSNPPPTDTIQPSDPDPLVMTLPWGKAIQCH